MSVVNNILGYSRCYCGKLSKENKTGKWHSESRLHQTNVVSENPNKYSFCD